MSFFEPTDITHESVMEEIRPTLSRNKLLIFVLFVSIVVGVYGYLLYKSDQYESNALILVTLGRENSEAPITAENASIFTDGVRAEEINSYVRLLSSHTLIEDAIDSVGLERFYVEPTRPDGLVAIAKYEIKRVAKVVKGQVDEAIIYVGLRPDLSDRDKVIKLIKRSMVVARERESNVITISLRLVDPTLARDFVGELVTIYSEKHIAVRKNDNIRLAFENQTEMYRGELVRMRDEMMTIRKEWGITSIEDQRRELVLEALRVESSLKQKRAMLAQFDSQKSEITDLLTALPLERRQAESKERNPTVELLNDELVRMRVERADTAKRYDEDSPILALLDEKLLDIESLLSLESEQITKTVVVEPNPLRDAQSLRSYDLSIDRRGVVSGIESDLARLDELQMMIQRLNDGGNLLEMAQLEYDVLEDRYKLNAARLEQAKITQELDAQQIANVALISGPTFSLEPVAPRRLLIMAVGIVGAFIASLGLTLLKEWIGARIYGRRDLESIPGVQYLGRFRLYR